MGRERSEAPFTEMYRNYGRSALTKYALTYILTYMPTVSLYIKNEDYVQWLAVENKSEFVHAALNGSGAVPEKKPTPKTTETPKSEPQFHKVITLPKPEAKPKNEDEYDPLDDSVY